EQPRIEIAPWPIRRRRDWIDWVNSPQTPAEEQAIQRSLAHDRPFGSDDWTRQMERRLNLGPLRRRGRPKNTASGSP
ncbi:MAG: hypothetical protein L6Q38_14765, partial [Nitrospira sp.]|nr:hypothetical protein [Nitrospira sp.]